MKKEYNKMFTETEKPKKEKLNGLKPTITTTDEFVAEKKPVTQAKPNKPLKAIVVDCSKLNIRETPSKDASILCTVNPGDTLQVEDVCGDWAHIYTSAGVDGFVMRKFIKVDIE